MLTVLYYLISCTGRRNRNSVEEKINEKGEVRAGAFGRIEIAAKGRRTAIVRESENC